MSNFRRIPNEKKLNEKNIKYNCYKDENNVMKFNTNHGYITIVILSEYQIKN